MSFEGGDEERKARSSLDQLQKSGLAIKKDLSYQGSGGRGVVYYDATIGIEYCSNVIMEVPEVEEASVVVGASGIEGITDHENCPF